LKQLIKTKSLIFGENVQQDIPTMGSHFGEEIFYLTLLLRRYYIEIVQTYWYANQNTTEVFALFKVCHSLQFKTISIYVQFFLSTIYCHSIVLTENIMIRIFNISLTKKKSIFIFMTRPKTRCIFKPSKTFCVVKM